MNLSLTTLAVSVVALAAVSTPAFAGDWNNGDGSLKDPRGRAAVAVPAPMPIPDTGPGWYLRGDVGIGRAGSKDISEKGMLFGQSPSTDAAGNVTQMTSPLSPFGSSPSWFNNDGKTLLNYGAGIGYHWSHNFRTDVTLDRRNTDKYTGSGNYAYTTTATLAGAPPTLISTTSSVGRVTDDTALKSGALLLNGYYDVGTRHGFTPYIGAGVGLALLTARRDVNITQTDTCVTVAGCAIVNTNTSSSSATTNALSFAAMATVGVSYALTQNTAIDVNYRYLFVNGTDISTTVNGQNSRITLGDIGEHQLRAGLRWDIN